MAVTEVGRSARERKTILVVDDSPDVRLILSLILDEAGYDIETADDGDDALAKLETVRPDVLLVDIMMPGLDGFDLVLAIRDMPGWRDVPIVAMSAKFTLMNPRRQAFQAYVPKPFSPDRLLRTLADVVQQGANATS